MSFRTAFTAFTATATPATPPAISGRVERATFRSSIPSLGAGNRQDAAGALPAPRTYAACRMVARLYEYIGADEYTPGDTFNVDAAPHAVTTGDYVFDSVTELVEAVRRDGVTFEASGTHYAIDPEGSYVIDYATGEREAVSWHFDSIPGALLERVIIPAVDAR